MGLLRGIVVALLGSMFLTGSPGCGSRGDHAVLDWVDMRPPAVTGITTPVAELAKCESFDWNSWMKQGRALPDAEETIIRLLKSHDKRLDRRKAMDALRDIGTDKSVPVLLECLRDEDGVVCNRAIAALEQIGTANDEIFTSLVRCLNDGAGENVRISAARALGGLFGQPAVEAIRQHQERLDREAKLIARILDDLKNGRKILDDVKAFGKGSGRK